MIDLKQMQELIEDLAFSLNLFYEKDENQNYRLKKDVSNSPYAGTISCAMSSLRDLEKVVRKKQIAEDLKNVDDNDIEKFYDDMVDKWHNCESSLSLQEYMGLKKQEYHLYVSNFDEFKKQLLESRE